jgi:hypothetical protein
MAGGKGGAQDESGVKGEARNRGGGRWRRWFFVLGKARNKYILPPSTHAPVESHSTTPKPGITRQPTLKTIANRLPGRFLIRINSPAVPQLYGEFV